VSATTHITDKRLSYPDAQIWRSLNGGQSWTNLYNFSYPGPDYQLAVTRDYTWDISVAPWIQSFTTDSKQIGWGIEGLQIDPHDSNHFLYGTGLTLYGSKNLLQWVRRLCPQGDVMLTASVGRGPQHHPRLHVQGH
jgi:hypothetical protein